MPSVRESSGLVDGIVRLRRAARAPGVAADVAPVRRELESRLGPTLSRSRAARILGVSQTAFDRWVDAGQIPVVIEPGGRRAVPRQFVVEAREALDRLGAEGDLPHPLAAVLAARREAAESLTALGLAGRERAAAPASGHATAERRGLAYHAVVAERLDEAMLADASANLEQLVRGEHIAPDPAARWRGLLASPPDEVARAIVADTPEGRDLRQNTPFAGVLNEQERRRIIEATR